ncbi:MAG: dihydrodipicolinate synthase family protein [Gemmatimonadetes bacterium]|nr:dihydrodipicolinate synthase family protein [Gemmatimonadota bacterium]
MHEATRALLQRGGAIPAHPLALTAARTLDERHQRALTRYYCDAGAIGVAVGVHTTQFAIRAQGLYEPVLALAADTIRASLAESPRPFVRVAGAIGPTAQAVREAEIAARLGYDCVLLSLAALPKASDNELIAHCRAVADVLPLFGFYLQGAVGGRPLGESFWRAFSEIPNVCAIKIAPFNRYQTLDVVRAIADSGREDIALYTGNDDNIVADLVSQVAGASGSRSMVGGLLGQFAVGTRHAGELCQAARIARDAGSVPASLLADGLALTDINAALFDVAHGFAGCIAGIHEVLRRQGLMAGTWCLDPAEALSPGQSALITRAMERYPACFDSAFVEERLAGWLR